MEKDNRVYLQDILDCIERIEGYLQDFDYDIFQQDRRTIDAVVRNVEVIGEAASNLSDQFRSTHTQIEWRKMIDTRNRIIHGYATVDLEIIWNIAQNDLEQLALEIEQIIARME